jgi:hypothetical protein
VLDLDTQNRALLLKNLDKFYNNNDIPWVKLVKGAYYNNGTLPGGSVEGSFWWKTHLKLVDTFKGLAKCNLGNGKSSLFWQDNWDDNCLMQSMPHLITYARNHLITVRDVLDTEFLEDLFHLPLSQQAYSEFLQMEMICQTAREKISNDESDKWSYIWGSNTFSVHRAYNCLIGYQEAQPHFGWIWKSSCQPKHKFFFWLLLHDRLNTRNLLRRKNMTLPSYYCVQNLCHQQEEDITHLFWNCNFAKVCWNYICPQRRRNGTIFQAFYDIKKKLNVPFAMELIILAAWGIWISRNNKIFNNQEPSFESWKAIFLQEAKMLTYRMKKKHADSFKEWLQSQT